MTQDEAARAVANNNAPSLATVAKAHPLINPPSCDAAQSYFKTYMQCDKVPQETRNMNKKQFDTYWINPPGGDKAGFCKQWLDVMKRNKANLCADR